ncbi:Retrovirus-related Pol polyprotein from transposon [Smittium culicis]|uniref:Retrovirus-related Pol polyprotein from transposon n=1 Tax=Smittium culicis TaxID=133412 RepID=A0A1R1YBG2_9FUNG|nr:Retrovirus-related Pol polyprotein from transposon [Smittium culicis]
MKGLETNKTKVEAMCHLKSPRNLKEHQSFLEMVEYYRKFIRNFNQVAYPLNKLLKKTESWNWTQKCEGAVEKSKNSLTKDPVLSIPDWEQRFIITTDASGTGLGAFLS